MPEQTLECPGCGVHLNVADLLWPIPEVSEKVLPGETMPLGECPDCGAMVLPEARSVASELFPPPSREP